MTEHETARYVPAARRAAEGAEPATTATPAAGAKVYRPLAQEEPTRPEPPTPRMIDALPPQYTEVKPPLMYRLVKAEESGRAFGRIAESRTYRAKAFSCGFFYKPLSRCFVEWEE